MPRHSLEHPSKERVGIQACDLLLPPLEHVEDASRIGTVIPDQRRGPLESLFFAYHTCSSPFHSLDCWTL